MANVLGMNEVVRGLIIPPYDYMAGVETDSDTETYTFRVGGAAGTIVATLVINYSSSEKTFISNMSITLP